MIPPRLTPHEALLLVEPSQTRSDMHHEYSLDGMLGTPRHLMWPTATSHGLEEPDWVPSGEIEEPVTEDSTWVYCGPAQPADTEPTEIESVLYGPDATQNIVNLVGEDVATFSQRELSLFAPHSKHGTYHQCWITRESDDAVSVYVDLGEGDPSRGIPPSEVTVRVQAYGVTNRDVCMALSELLNNIPDRTSPEKNPH